MVWCPGCEMHHVFDRRWQFDGNMERPTFRPSLKVTYTYGDKREPRVCHSYVRDGQWEYLNDSTHELAGQTVPLTNPE